MKTETARPMPAWKATLLEAATVSREARLYRAAPELLACLKHAAQNYTPKAWAILADSEVEWQKRTLAAISEAEGR